MLKTAMSHLAPVPKSPGLPYLPHHPVIPQDKSTTKIRTLFDGAAIFKYGPRLNGVL